MTTTHKLVTYLKPYRRWVALAPLMMILEVAMDLMQPRLLQRIVDDGIAHHQMTLVVHIGALMLTAAFIGLFGGMACTFFAVLAGQGFGADVRNALFSKVQTLSFGNLDALETGGLITRLTNDVTQVQDMLMMMLRVMVRVPLLLVGSLIMGILTSPGLAILFLILIPAVSLTLVWIVRKSAPMFTGVQRRLDSLNTVLQENLAGVRVVKAFARGNHENERFSDANNGLMGLNIDVVRLSAVTMPFMMLCVNVGVVSAVYFGGIKVVAGGMKVGQLIAFINYLQQTLISLMMVSMFITRFARAEASAKRIEEVLAETPRIPAMSQPLQSFAPAGRVALDNVSFSYDGDDRDPVLAGVSFTAEPGQTVAILGATGAGKSSLVNLIPRFYDAAKGSISIDGIDVRKIDERSLRSSIGIALQESILFSGTIRDNIRYGRPDADDDAVIAAAKMAQAHDFISGFPDGYDTVVGQRGVNLSGGQKQRLAIARVLLTDPSILILDDSTSAVDVRTEARIHEALARDPDRRTCIIVAQRISTVLNADKILVLDDGKIVAEGPHRELLNSSPIYREIYESQTENGVIIHAGE